MLFFYLTSSLGTKYITHWKVFAVSYILLQMASLVLGVTSVGSQSDDWDKFIKIRIYVSVSIIAQYILVSVPF